MSKVPSKPSAGPSGRKNTNYQIGYGRPPQHTRFRPGKSGNPKGRPKDRPSAHALLLEEASKLVKVKTGDKIVQVPRMRALMRKLLDLGLQGNVAAMRLALAYLSMAHAEAQLTHPHEAPLSDDELAVLTLFADGGERA
jgi:hypothetical protein